MAVTAQKPSSASSASESSDSEEESTVQVNKIATKAQSSSSSESSDSEEESETQSRSNNSSDSSDLEEESKAQPNKTPVQKVAAKKRASHSSAVPVSSDSDSDSSDSFQSQARTETQKVTTKRASSESSSSSANDSNSDSDAESQAQPNKPPTRKVATKTSNTNSDSDSSSEAESEAGIVPAVSSKPAVEKQKLRYVLPKGFSEVDVGKMCGFSMEHLTADDELYLVKMPLNFSPHFLTGARVKMDGGAQLADSEENKKNGVAFVWDVQLKPTGAVQADAFSVLLPSISSGRLQHAGHFKGEMCVRKSLKPKVKPALPTAPPKGCTIPAGLKPRFIPFGSDEPLRGSCVKRTGTSDTECTPMKKVKLEEAADTPHNGTSQKKKKKKKAKSREKEMDSTSCIDTDVSFLSNSSSSSSSKKSKKKSKR